MISWFGWCVVVLSATELLGPSPKPDMPPRIVSLAPAATEILFAMDAGDAVVGVTRFDAYPPAVTHLPKVGGLFDPDIEATAALHPTLVIALPAARERARHIARLGPQVLVAPAQTLEDMWVLISELGRLLGRQPAAGALASRLKKTFGELKTHASQAHPKPVRALLLVGHRPYVAAGPESFIDALLPLAGAVNAVQRGGPYPVMDAEAIVATHPEVIVNLVQSPVDLSFFVGSNTRVVHAYDDALMLPGPRLPEALRRLEKQLWASAP